jgi:hypothetical protein
LQTIQQAKQAGFKYCGIVDAYNLRRNSPKLPARLKHIVDLYNMGQNVQYYIKARELLPTEFHKLMLLFKMHKVFTRCYSQNVDAPNPLGPAQLLGTPLPGMTALADKINTFNNNAVANCVHLYGTVYYARCTRCSYHCNVLEEEGFIKLWEKGKVVSAQGASRLVSTDNQDGKSKTQIN